MAIFTGLVILGFLGGGGSRNDIPSLLYLQPAAVIALTLIVALPGRIDLASVRWPLIFLAALAACIALQLVPLPPSIWLRLPGHGMFAEAAAAVGMTQPWRPLSITPDETLASLTGLVVPAAVLVGYAALEHEHRPRVLDLLLVLVFLGCLLAIAQIAGGPNSWVYLYRITNEGSAVGWFANRNHQAAMLAATFPMIAAWATRRERNEARFRSRIAIAGTFCVFLIPMILVTGSRAGMFLAAAGLLASFMGFRRRIVDASPFIRQNAKMIIGGLVSVALTLAVAAILFSRARAWDRLFGGPATEDVRFGNLPIYFQMMRDFFPLGSGFGSFEALFKLYEPLDGLTRAYLNHAHNDLVELVITGSVPAILIVGAGAIWYARASFTVFSTKRPGQDWGLAKAGAIGAGIFFLASLFDYPLRTPLATVHVSLALAWLSDGSHNRKRSGRGVENHV